MARLPATISFAYMFAAYAHAHLNYNAAIHLEKRATATIRCPLAEEIFSDPNHADHYEEPFHNGTDSTLVVYWEIKPCVDTDFKRNPRKSLAFAEVKGNRTLINNFNQNARLERISLPPDVAPDRDFAEFVLTLSNDEFEECGNFVLSCEVELESRLVI